MMQNYLLKNKTAQQLYRKYSKDLPIIDYHNHISIEDMASNRKFKNIHELWIESDPYKHRLMRICGIEERYITGDASPYEKFEKFCGVFPYLVGNPVYDWSKMELTNIFHIKEVPDQKNARYLYDKCAEMLASPEFSNNAILSKFHIEYQSPVTTLMDDLSVFNGVTVGPSLRGDNLLAPSSDLKARLKQTTGIACVDVSSYLKAVGVMLDRFSLAGCRFADHSLDIDFFSKDEDGSKGDMLKRLGCEYAKRGWTLLLHVGAKRQTSSRLQMIAGPAGGYAASGEGFCLSALCDLLGGMEADGGLPDTVVFPLNMSDQAPISIWQGSFSQDGVASKVQLGPAWWWCDHALGIRNALYCISSFGLLSQFIGMTTDSRSILSFVRHDYFRRLLCGWMAEQNERCDWGLSEEIQGEIIQKICYYNAKDKMRRNG